MKRPESFVETLRAAADDAAAKEADFRRQAAREIAALERQREIAFRRLNLMRAIAEAARGAENESQAVAGSVAVLCSRLGYSTESEAQSAVLARFEPVAQAMFASLHREDGAPAREPAEALAEFENWYASAHPNHFWALFEEYLAETPRVDF